MSRQFRKAIILLTILFTMIIGNDVFADATIEYKGPENSQLIFLFTSSRMLIDMKIKHSPASILYDNAVRKMWLVDHSKRIYMEINEDLLGQFKEFRRKLEIRLSQLPPVFRQQMEEMMNLQGFVKIGVPQELCEGPKVIGTEMVQGLRAKVVDGCKSYVQGKWEICRGWFVEGSELGLRPEDFRVFESFNAFYLEFLGTIGLPEFLGENQLLLTQLKPDKGIDLKFYFPFPIKGAQIKDGKEIHTVILEKVSKTPIPETMFTIPKGYKEISIRLPKGK